ncbi:hypothetical protein IJ090_03085 [Candidatus Saccharibacteria bacterium]|nr:hypothetical protein [Candidatus Saccharibacteria bacterium]
MEATIESLDYKRGVMINLGGAQQGLPGSNAPKVILRLRVEDGFTRTFEQNIYWTITNITKSKKVEKRLVETLAFRLIGQKVGVKRDGEGGIYVSQDSLEELLLTVL